MNIAFITYHYLHGNGGGIYASRAYINAFAAIADEMTLLFPMKQGAEPEGIDKKVRLVPVWDKRSKLKKGLDLYLGWRNRYKHIETLIGKAHFDVAVLDASATTHGVLNYFKKQGTRVITIHHNFQYDYYRDNASIWSRFPLLYWSQYDERKAVLQSDLSLTLTVADKQLLKRHYGNGKENIEVLGTFEYKKKEPPVYPNVMEDRFLITGNLGATQTEDSIFPWIKDYFPVLKEVFPDASLTLAGRSPSPRLCHLAEQNGIEVIPSPVEMLPILSKAKYYICPTSLGGGLKLRVMDGLSTGLPVVCHEVSARGYEAFIDSGSLFVYNDIASFRTQLKKLRDTELNKDSAISLYEQIFSFGSGLERLKKLLQKYGIA